MFKTRRWLVPMTAVLALGVVTAGRAQAPELLPVGEKAPDFTLTAVDGKKLTLSEVTKKNKATLVNFFFNG